jgi:TPR repeat protein
MFRDRMTFRVEVGNEGSVMTCIDVDALAQFEIDANQGRPDALYNLGLAYSTGQGVGVDFVAAHKWFNLAALRGVDAAKSWRASIAKEMNTSQIAEAQRLAREWLSIAR